MVYSSMATTGTSPNRAEKFAALAAIDSGFRDGLVWLMTQAMSSALSSPQSPLFEWNFTPLRIVISTVLRSDARSQDSASMGVSNSVALGVNRLSPAPH